MAIGSYISSRPRSVLAAALLAVLLVAACGNASSGGSAVPAAPSATTTAAPASPVTATAAAATTSPAAAATAFSSDVYGYTVAVPADWQATAATAAWDGSAPAPTHEDPRADVLSRPDGATAA